MANASNAPSGSWTSSYSGQLQVIPRSTTSARITQLLYVYNPASQPLEYIRTMIGENTFGNWYLYPTREEITTLNSNLPYINSGTIFNTIKTAIQAGKLHGTFLAINISDSPNSTYNYIITYDATNGTGNVSVKAQLQTGTAYYISNMNYSSGSALYSWREVISIVNRINSTSLGMRIFNITTAGQTLTMVGGSRGFLLLSDTEASRRGMIVISCTSAGTTGYTTMNTMSGITVTTSTTNTLTLKSTGTTACLLIVIGGSIDSP